MHQALPLTDLFLRMRQHRRKLRAESTHQGYGTAIRQLASFLNRTPTIHDLNKDTINAFLSHLESLGRAASTINTRRALVLSMLHFAEEAELIPTKRMTIEKFPEPKTRPVTWSLADVEKMLAAAKALKGKVGPVKAKRFWRALLLVMSDSAPRIGALMQADVSDLDVRNCSITLRAEYQKTGVEQVLELHADTVKAVKKILQPEGPLFPWGPDNKQARLRRHFTTLILEPAGLPTTRKHKFHAFRRTLATAAAAELTEQDAADLLGHSDLKVTRSFYIDKTKRQRDRPVDLLERPRG